MKYTEDDLLPISALQHLIFCPRRCALVHLEQMWGDNVFTAEGNHLHEKTHDDLPVESRGEVRIVRSLRLHSYRLGLVGMADVVEFRRQAEGIRLPDAEGLWMPYPVEYKRGLLKAKREYQIQLCAQALCLEEMLHIVIPEGALYFGKSRRRDPVVFTETLRQATETAAQQLHELMESGRTPPAQYEKKCCSCSLLEVCMPKITGIRKDIEYYLHKDLTDIPEDGL